MSTTTKPTDFTAMSRLSADIDLLADGKATGFVRVPHSVHRSAYGWIPIPIVRIKNGDGPSVLMQAGTHGDEWEGQIGLGNLLRALEPKDIRGRLVILPSANFPAAMAGQRTSAALTAKGYHHRFVFSKATGHCDGKVFNQTLADTLVWVWRGYHAE